MSRIDSLLSLQQMGIMLFVDCFKIHVMAESILERPEVLMALELSDWIFSRVRIIGSKVLQ